MAKVTVTKKVYQGGYIRNPHGGYSIGREADQTRWEVTSKSKGGPISTTARSRKAALEIHASERAFKARTKARAAGRATSGGGTPEIVSKKGQWWIKAGDGKMRGSIPRR